MVLTKPYLSIVATTRNDDHGGSLNRRTQAFIDGVTGQAHRHRLETELLLVEWNPPADRAPLREVFRWPEDNPWCEVRIVTVPAELHARYRFADQLPMLQMIAKNVGVRRARGEYVLATNVDILFADEIFAFLAARRLEPDVLYRSDRVDVDRHVPLNVPIEKRLAHCRNTVLRIARKGGMWIVPEGAPARSVEFAQPVAYVPPVFAPRPRKQGLLAGRWSEVTQQGRVAGRGFLRSIASAARRAGRRVLQSVRFPFVHLLAFLQKAADRPFEREGSTSSAVASWLNEALIVLGFPLAAGALFVRAVAFGLRRGLRHVRAAVRVRLRASFVGDCVRRMRVYRSLVYTAQDRLHAMGYRATPSEVLDELLEYRRLRAIPQLHTNACGDFMLANRDTWMKMRGSPELVMYSMHLDSLTMMTAYKLGIRMEELPSEMVHYHIEHGNGWTPDQGLQLYRRMNGRGVRILTHGQYLRYATYVLHLPHHFLSSEDWGLGSATLPEEIVTHRMGQAAERAAPLRSELAIAA